MCVGDIYDIPSAITEKRRERAQEADHRRRCCQARMLLRKAGVAARRGNNVRRKNLRRLALQAVAGDREVFRSLLPQESPRS